MSALDFREFASIPRLSREIVITEKIDGTNGCIAIWRKDELVLPNDAIGIQVRLLEATHEGIDFVMLPGSRSKWIGPPSDDNYGFAKWVFDNKDELVKLGPGTHFGEWWGQGIQRKYGLTGKRFSLFNTSRWTSQFNTVLGLMAAEKGALSTACNEITCCHVTPVLSQGMFSTAEVDNVLSQLSAYGSAAAPGFMKPEGVVVFHVRGNLMFKKTLIGDAHKGA